MAKIVEVANAMISNKNKITHVLKSSNEYYFIYNNKYKWSISEAQTHFYLHFYPTQMSLEELTTITDWSNFSEMVTYSTLELKTTEAIETFRELYQIVSERVFGLDEIFDEIINE